MALWRCFIPPPCASRVDEGIRVRVTGRRSARIASVLSLTALRAGPPLLGWYTSGGPPRGRSLLKDRDVRTYAKKIPFDFHFRPIRIYGICLCPCLSLRLDC